MSASWTDGPEPEVTLLSGERVLQAVHDSVLQLLSLGYSIEVDDDRGVVVFPHVHENCLHVLDSNRSDVQRVLDDLTHYTVH